MSDGRRVLVVDNDTDVREFMADALQTIGCEVYHASDGDRALREVTLHAPDVVFMDVNIPGQDGWLVCRKLKLGPSAPIVALMTQQRDERTTRFAEFVDADDLLSKPLSLQALLSVAAQIELAT